VLVAIAAVLVVAGLVVGLVLALGGGHGTTTGASPAPNRTTPTPTPTLRPTAALPPRAPSFDFRVLKSTPVRGSSRTRIKKVRHTTRRAVQNIRDDLGRMYRLAFLVPADWQHDRYGPAFQLFAGTARSTARAHPTLLTLGPDAGKRFSRVASASGTLKIRVLLDRGGHPFTAVATADFRARAVRTAGGATLVHSLGSYFLRPSKHGWLIFGFQVRRKDHPAA
jgi:hypothetical protein